MQLYTATLANFVDQNGNNWCLNNWLGGENKTFVVNFYPGKLPETNIAGWKIQHFDGIYKERWDFHGRAVSFRECTWGNDPI